MYKLKSGLIKDTHIVKRKGKLFLYCIAGNQKRKMELLILISSAFDSWAEKLSHINRLLAGIIGWANPFHEIRKVNLISTETVSWFSTTLT